MRYSRERAENRSIKSRISCTSYMEPRGPNAHGRAKVGVVQERNPAREARHAPDAYVFSNFYSNFWIIFGKL